jgi:hypothetical protein
MQTLWGKTSLIIPVDIFLIALLKVPQLTSIISGIASRQDAGS